ncbi:uncharacterized protein [Drosophila suzukii]|uniref:Chitin-binding type-2 domain-containing protein n=1 Tax=Drosophila suzukii TaxID=28584 RepID=A0AB39ZT71_DROSZ
MKKHPQTAQTMRLQALLWPLACCLVLLLLPSGILSQCNDSTQPGCLHQAEEGVAQRHCLDPTKYWLCSAIGQQAQLKKCQPNTGFDQDLNACVPWIAWVWQPCPEPPSRPPGWEPC